MNMLRVWIFVLFIAGFLAGCTQNPSVPADPTSLPDSDTLTLSLDEIDSLGLTGSSLATEPDMDLQAPRVDHYYDADLTEACKNVYNQDWEFGNEWANFRTVTFSGAGNVAIRQTIAVYSDSRTAGAEFDRLKANLAACHHPGDPYKLEVVDDDPNTISTHTGVSINGQGTTRLYRLLSSILIEVRSAHFGNDQEIAQAVLQKITDKVNSAA